MKAGLRLLIILFSSVSLLCCQDDKEDTVEVSSDKISLSTPTNSGTFTIIASGDWTITSSDSWCTVSPASGAGTADIKVKGLANESAQGREARVTITSGKLVKVVTIKQSGLALTVESDNLEFPAEGGLKKVKLLSEDAEWTISPFSDPAITISPMQGKGAAELSIVLVANTVRKEKTLKLTINFNGQQQYINIKQAAGPNNAPSVPVLNAPQDNDMNVFVVPEFRWAASTDVDGDNVFYTVVYSTDQTNWTETKPITTIRQTLTQVFPKQTKVYWKIKASDGKGGISESQVYRFTTSNVAIPEDGSYTQYAAGAPLDGPIPVIFIGDGFTAGDYVAGGNFDQKVNEGIEHFFATEPFKSYRASFKAYKVVAFSEESGASRWNGTTNNYVYQKKTAFDTRYYGNGYDATYMTTNLDKVYQYAMKIPGITGDVLDNTTVVLIINDPCYSGTCWQSWSGRSVSIVPTCDANQPYTYRQTMAHEAGGHGFGRLADEYLFSNSAIDENAKNNIINWSTTGANANIDVKYKREEIKWRHFFTVPGYEMVGVYSGAQYASGVWMPESSSAMRDMTTPYYNAPSREAIVKRIMKNLNQPYTFDLFKSKDIKPSQAVIRKAAAVKSVMRPNHTPPQIWKGK